MSARELVRLTGVAVCAASLVVGASIATGYVVDVVAERDQLRAQVQAIRPTAAATPPARVTVTPVPSPIQGGGSSPSPAASRTIQQVSVRLPGPSRNGDGNGDGDGGGSATGRGGGGAGTPAAPDTPPAECSPGQLVSVSLPLALPCNAIQIGGTTP